MLEKDVASTWLDIQAKNLFISNKLGLTTASFINDNRVDKGWPGISYSIDPDWQVLTLSHDDVFLSTTIDNVSTTGSTYSTISTLTPVGVSVVSQDNYTDTKSLAFSNLNTSVAQRSQSISLNFSPSGDFLTIPLVSSATEINSDNDHWIFSDVSKLNDPSPWFNGGWRGGQLADSRIINTESGSSITSNQSNVSWINTFLQGTQGYCRQIQISFTVFGLPASEDFALDYFLYVGGVRVMVSPTSGTPVGSIQGTFKPKTDKSASGTFTIPYGISPGQVEIKVVSSPTVIRGNEWQFIASGIYNSVANSSTINRLNNCRCNCYSCNRCANCWSCTGRCGTGPIAESFRVSASNQVLRSIDIDYYSVNNRYGVTVSVFDTDNGQPTSNTISNYMLGRKYLNPTQLVGAGFKSHVFDDPIVLNSGNFAILLTPEDGFNINANAEILAGRDICVKTAQVGRTDKNTNTLISNKSYTLGTLWDTTSGSTWIENETTDIKFRANFNLYPKNITQIIQMRPITVTNATSFMCAWNSNTTNNTSIIFQYSMGDGVWYQFAPFTLVDLPKLSNIILVRSLLSSNESFITPFVENTCNFYVQSRNPNMSVVTNSFDLSENEFGDQLDIWIDSHLPVGFTQKVRVTFNEGVSWVDLNLHDGGLTGLGISVTLDSVSPINLNEGQETYTYHWTLTLPPSTTFTSFKTELNLNSTHSLQLMNLERPTIANYIAIPSLS